MWRSRGGPFRRVEGKAGVVVCRCETIDANLHFGLVQLCDHFLARSLFALKLCFLFVKFFRCEQPELLKRSVELFHLLFGQC